MTSRIHRGFHRIGVVLAVPVLLVAGWLAGHETWMQWTAKDPYAEFDDAPLPAKKAPNVFDQFDLPSDTKAPLTAPYYRADYTIAAFVLALSIALYVAARALGWVLAGFLRS